LWAAFWEFRRSTIIIDPIEVGKDLSDKGYTPHAIAQRIAGELAALQRTAHVKSRFEEDFELSATQLDFTVPSAGISYRGLIRYLRQLTGRFQQRVQGEIVCDNGTIRLQLRTSEGSKTSNDLVITAEGEITTLLQKAALEIGLLIAPYLILNYWFRVEQSDRRFEKTFAVAQWCLANTPANHHHRAYIAWGSALAIQRDFDKAEEKFRMALRLKAAQTYNSLGNLNRARRRFDEAATMYRKAMFADLRDPNPRSNLGNVCNDRRDYHKALRCFRQAISLNPRHETAWSGAGYAQWKLGKYAEAERTFARAIDIDPKFGWSYLNWSRVLQSQHRFQEAIVKVQAATALKPTEAEAYAFWGDILIDAGKFHEATEMYQRAGVANPGLGYEPGGLTFSLVRRKRYHEAIRAAEETISINPYHMSARMNVAESLRFLHRYDEAIEKYKEVLSLDRYQSVAHVGWGQVLRARHMLDFAFARFKSATRIDSRDVWAWRSLGDTCIEMHRYKAAIRKFRKAAEIEPWNAWGHIGWGDALVRLGRLDEAVARYRHACRQDGRNGWAWRRVIDTLIDLGRRDEAVAEMHKALAATVGQERIFLAASAHVLERLGRSEEAAQIYEQISFGRPDADVLLQWGRSLLNLKAFDKALEVFRRALAIDRCNENALRAIAETLKRTDRIDVAFRLYSMASRRAPESIWLLLDWSALLRHQGQQLKGNDEEKRKEFYAKAEAKILQAINVDEWNTTPWRALGDLLMELERPQEALKRYNSALFLDQCDWLAWVGRGDALRACKRRSAAVKAYERALRLRPNVEWLLTRLAQTLQELGRHDQAIRKLERVLELSPRDTGAQTLRNQSLRKLGRF